MKKCLLILLSFAAFSCSGSGDRLLDFNEITGPRVLAIIADKPEASPGDEVTITPVISDLHATTGVQYSIRGCVDLGISHGASPTCELKDVIRKTLTLPGVGENWTGAADPVSFKIPNDTMMFARRSHQDKYNGVSYIVEYTLYSPSGIEIKTIKRIVVTESTKTQKNQNPILTDIFANSVSMTNLPVGRVVTLSNNLTNTSAENYNLMDNKGNLKNFTEKLTVTWFITDGKMKYYRSLTGGTNEYAGPSSTPVGRSAYILVLARDDRGGVAIVTRKLN